MQYPNNMMLLGDALLCPPVARVPREKAPRWVCRLRQTTQVEHGEVAFATAMRPPIDSDGERLAHRCSLLWVKNAKYSERADNFRFAPVEPAPFERTSPNRNAMSEKCHKAAPNFNLRAIEMTAAIVLPPPPPSSVIRSQWMAR
jgi:hypothetical protein